MTTPDIPQARKKGHSLGSRIGFWLILGLFAQSLMSALILFFLPLFFCLILNLDGPCVINYQAVILQSEIIQVYPCRCELVALYSVQLGQVDQLRSVGSRGAIYICMYRLSV